MDVCSRRRWDEAGIGWDGVGVRVGWSWGLGGMELGFWLEWRDDGGGWRRCVLTLDLCFPFFIPLAFTSLSLFFSLSYSLILSRSLYLAIALSHSIAHIHTCTCTHTRTRTAHADSDLADSGRGGDGH